jgi:penicillin-binding protein 1A
MKKYFHIFLRVLVNTGIAGICAVIFIVLYTNAQLPPVRDLQDIQLHVPLKIYTADGKLIGEYGEERRAPLTIDRVPDTLKKAVLATEDRRFYEHNGVDIRGLARASIHLLISGTKSQGASTITMQVARNFFLTQKKTFTRKLNEILLALKIETELPKDKILELYLNKIYFGKHAYGVQAAAQVYYGTTIDKLTLAQTAMIAGLPQAPSSINPINNPEAALKRRTHVLKRMLHYGFITEKEFETAVDTPIGTSYHGRVVDVDAPYVAEMARKELLDKLGPEIYSSGYIVTTTIDSRLQSIATHALQQGLLEYDKRHGYRGPVAQLKVSSSSKIDTRAWSDQLKGYPKTAFTLPAAVISVGSDHARAVLPNHQTITLTFASMQWAKRQLSRSREGAPPQSPADVVAVGDIIYVEPGNNEWVFSQLPEAEGALVAVHPQKSTILAMVGGFDFNLSHFNRATQATRQPGSNFKPFVYAAALENGFTAASIINDAPIVFRDNNVEDAWRPQNDTRRFYGPTRLRVGLMKSRNLVSIRLLQSLGIGKAFKVIERFGFERSRLPRSLSLALGAGTASPLEMVTGFATFANGGAKIDPYLIARVEDSQHKVIYEAPIAQKEQIISPQTAYIMNSILQDVIQDGTGRAARALNRSDIAGKTGTTNNQFDAWFSGYNPTLAASVWVGFDEPHSLQEHGSQAALPIWMKFMGPALQGTPTVKLEQPEGIAIVKIDPATGLLARPGQGNAIFEMFAQNQVPQEAAASLGGGERGAITPSGNSGDSGDTLF